MFPLRGVALAAVLAATAVSAQVFPLAIDTSRVLDAGLDHNVVVRPYPDQGEVWAWGGNAGGKLGNGSTINASVPVRVGRDVAGFTDLVAVAASQASSYAIGSDGTLWAWGDHSDGFSGGSRLGLGAAPSPALDSCTVDGVTKPCARSPRKVPIPGTPGATLSPTRMVVQVGAGWGHVVALLDDGSVWSWGDNTYSQLGRGAGAPNSASPVQVKNAAGSGVLGDITQIAVGYFHTVALTSTGTLLSWGRGDDGQLGNGSLGDSALPVAVGGLNNVSVIRAKGQFTLAVKGVDTSLWAWGSNRYGQLGIGPSTPTTISPLSQAVPVRMKGPAGVGFLTGVWDVAAGYTTAFALKADGTVWAWGLDAEPDPNPQLGVPTTDAKCGAGANRKCVRFPTPLPSAFNNPIAVAAGGAHSAIIKADSSFGLFGNNASGQLAKKAGVALSAAEKFSQSRWDPDGYMFPQPLSGSGSSVGAQSRIGGLSMLTLGAGIEFAPQRIGTTSAGQQVTFENLDSVSVHVFVGVGPPFSPTPECDDVTVPANTSCTFTLTYSPSERYYETSTMRIFTSSAENPQIDVILAGTGIDLPGAAGNVVALAGDGLATVTFSGADDGGSSTMGYTVTSNPPGGTDENGGVDSRSHTVTGLTNGVSYTFTVTATNAAGPGPPSLPSNSVTPASSFALTVIKAGSGAGTVTSAPGGIDCGATCAFTYASGASVTLTGSPASGSRFGGFTGPGCGGVNAKCVVTMSSLKNYTATFDLIPMVALTVGKTGTGSGTVVASPAGIDCGATCTSTYPDYTWVTLTATPASGSVFSGWTGAGCSGVGICEVQVITPASVSAAFDLAGPPARLFNISTRGQVLGGNDVMIAGFIVGGSTSKTVVINVAGPSLVPAGIPNALMNPTLRLVRSSDQVVLATNDDWQAQAVPAHVASITASGFQPNNAAEPAIIATLAPGAYTAIVEGAGATTGVGLVGVFEVDHPEIPLVNISTRGQVQAGNDVMIAGFIVQGTGAQKVVINVAGPSLVPAGITNALANPTLSLVRSSDQVVLATNDNWQTQANPADVAAIQATGFQPNNVAEPAIIATLPPGAYTAIVSGAGGSTGVGLVGVFTTP